jgi:hypothetical protein
MAVTAGVVAVAAAAAIAGALSSKSAAKKAAAQAKEQFDAQMARLNALQIPDVEKQKLQLEMYQYYKDYIPQLEQTIQQADTELKNIVADPSLRESQMEALSLLSQLGETAFTDGEKADLRQMRREVAGQEQSRQQGILQDLASRGQLGSGQELAARLSSSQAATERASNESDNMSKMAQERMLQAVMGAGSMGGQIRSQDFDEASKTAAAQDIVNQFNTQNKIGVQQRNIANKNQAEQTNIANRQNLMNDNTALNNQQQQYNKELLQQKFQNEFMKATGQNAVSNNIASNALQQGAAKAQAYTNMASGVGQMAIGAGGMFGGGGSTASTSGYQPQGDVLTLGQQQGFAQLKKP